MLLPGFSGFGTAATDSVSVFSEGVAVISWSTNCPNMIINKLIPLGASRSAFDLKSVLLIQRGFGDHERSFEVDTLFRVVSALNGWYVDPDSVFPRLLHRPETVGMLGQLRTPRDL